MIESVFKSVLVMSFVGSLLSVVLIMAKPITKKLFGFKWQYYIWYAVLGVMLLPLSVTIAADNDLTPHISASTVEMGEAEHFSVASHEVEDVLSQQKQTNLNGRVLFKSAAYVWAVYGCMLLLSKLIRYFIYLQIIRKKSIKLSKADNVQIWRTSLISAPLTVGLFRKKILIPDGVYDEKHIEHILLHENTHIKHGDIYFKWISMLVKCVHWFNPMVYILAGEARRLCEMVCDIDSTENMDEPQRKAYMNTILTLASSAAGSNSELTTHMANGKSCIVERFGAIVSRERGKIKSLSAVFAVLFVVFSVGVSALAGGFFCEDSPLCFRLELKRNGYSDSSADALDNGKDTSLNAISRNENAEDNSKDATIESDSENSVPDGFSEQAIQNTVSLPVEYFESESNNEHEDDSVQVSEEAINTPDEETETEYEKYPYSGQVRYDGLTFEKIISEIDKDGGEKLYPDNSGVSEGYITGKLTYKNSGVANHEKIRCDDNGQIIFYMDSEYDQHVNIAFNQNGKQIAGYGIIPDNETTYVFGGFNPGEEYDIEISTSTGSTWMIESDYLLY